MSARTSASILLHTVVVLLVGLDSGFAPTASAQEARAATPLRRPTSRPTEPTPAPASNAQGTLRLVTGDDLGGELLSSSRDREVRWRWVGAEQGVGFPHHYVKRMTFKSEAGEERKDLFRVKLRGDDVFYGTPTAFSRDAVTFESATLGTADVRRDAIVTIENLEDPALVYLGPRGAGEWRCSGNDTEEGGWALVRGELVTRKFQATATKDLGLDEGRIIDLDLSWSEGVGRFVKRPGFRVAIGAGVSSDAVLYVETWGDELVAYREGSDHIDAVAMGAVPSRDIFLRITCDPAENEIRLACEERFLATLPRPEGMGRELIVENTGPAMRLRSVRVVRFGGSLLDSQDARKIIDGREVTALDDVGELELADGTRFPLARTERLDFEAPQPEPAEQSSPENDAETDPARVEVFLVDGGKLRGRFERVEEDRFIVTTDWSRSPLETPKRVLSQVVFLDRKRVRRVGRRHELAAFGGKYRGRITGWSEETGSFIWTPTAALDGAPLVADVDGVVTVSSESDFYVGGRRCPHQIYFRNGDHFPCKVLSVSERELIIASPFSGRATIPVAAVKAIEIDPRVARKLTRVKKPDPQQNPWGQGQLTQRDRKAIDEERRAKLLSLPRKYKHGPPEHLVISVTGDAIRGALQGVFENTLVIRSQLSDYRIPLARVALLVWIDPPRKKPLPPLDPKYAEGMQVDLDDRTLVTLTPVGATPEQLEGMSPLLGACRIDWTSIRNVRLGSRRGGAPSFYADWQAQPMKEPFPDAPEEGEPSPAPAAADGPAEATEVPWWMPRGATTRPKD